jgi:hypothetical protein
MFQRATQNTGTGQIQELFVIYVQSAFKDRIAGVGGTSPLGVIAGVIRGAVASGLRGI